MADIVVVVDDSRHGGVKDRKQVEACFDAIGAVPERRRGKKMRCKQAEVMRVP
jgi:hypothetical protein